MNRGRHKSSFNPPQPPHRRDSDASCVSSRPSSVGITSHSTAADLIADRSYQQSAIRSINAYLSAHSVPLQLKPSSLPSNKEAALLLNTILSHLDWPDPSFPEDLPHLLKYLNCPFKLTKSSLRTPNTPHSWPHIIPIVHWLTQFSSYLNHSSSKGIFHGDNNVDQYYLDSYLRFIRGEDDAVEELDAQFIQNLEKERDSVRESVERLERDSRELESRLDGFRSGGSLTEAKEREREVLEEDVRKFKAVIGEVKVRMNESEKAVFEKETALKVKEEERKRVEQENEELRKAVTSQTFNARDVERMKRELMTVERETAEAEGERNRAEEKCWEMDAVIGHKFKELEEFSMECNKAIRKFVPKPLNFYF